ncbi:hypothetical protein GCM10017710_26920 [Arthrobacter ramosus]
MRPSEEFKFSGGSIATVKMFLKVAALGPPEKPGSGRLVVCGQQYRSDKGTVSRGAANSCVNRTLTVFV